MFVIGWGKRVCLKDILDNVKKEYKYDCIINEKIIINIS